MALQPLSIGGWKQLSAYDQLNILALTSGKADDKINTRNCANILVNMKDIAYLCIVV